MKNRFICVRGGKAGVIPRFLVVFQVHDREYHCLRYTIVPPPPPSDIVGSMALRVWSMHACIRIEHPLC